MNIGHAAGVQLLMQLFVVGNLLAQPIGRFLFRFFQVSLGYCAFLLLLPALPSARLVELDRRERVARWLHSLVGVLLRILH